MPRQNAPLYAFNGGEVGLDAIARLDLDRVQRAAELMENAFPTVVGRMDFRPGFEFIAGVDSDLAGTRQIPFVFDSSNQFNLILTTDSIRILHASNDEYISRGSVSTTVQNGDFSSFIGWSDDSTGSASADVDSGNLRLQGASGATAIARQTVSVIEADRTVEHGFRITVVRGPVAFRIGTNTGLDDIVSEVQLEEGTHSLAVTPGATTTDLYIQLSTEENRTILVDEVIVESSGIVELPHPWDAAGIQSVKYAQSLDVLFIASQGYQQRRIERRGDTSWSIVRYKANDGPFTLGPDNNVTLQPSVIEGVGTLTASVNFFEDNQVGSLVRLTHSQQREEETFTADNQNSDSIRIFGVGTARQFTVSIAVSVDDPLTTPADESWEGTITLEQSIGEEGNWTTFRTFTGDFNDGINDDLDNQIVFYRLRVNAGDYTRGTANTVMTYAGGQTQGIARIVNVQSATVADVEVLQPFGAITATTTWDMGTWSDANGWPTSVAIHDGRLWWGRGDTVFGSVSDQFDSYDDNTAGDSAPVIRSVGVGAQRGILWMQSLLRLITGTDISEVSIRSSSFDEPLTATAFVPRDVSTRGCLDIQPIKIDTSAIFVQRSAFRIFDLFYSAESSDYVSRDLTELHQNICRPGVVSMAIQRQPDTRIWFVLSNGEARVLTYEPSEQVVAWSRVTIDGDIEDVISLPSSDEDYVYIIAKRTVNNVERRYVERLANSQQAIGGNINKISDSFVHIQNTSPSATISGLDHLEGEQVIVWADGQAIHDQDNLATVTGGAITNTTEYTNVVVGKAYTGRWRSTKLAYGAALGTALLQYKKIDHLGLYMINTAPDGVRIGRNDSNVTRIGTSYRGRPLVSGEVLSIWDQDAPQINGGWDTDSRVYLEMRAPYPASIAAMTINIKTNDRG